MKELMWESNWACSLAEKKGLMKVGKMGIEMVAKMV